MRTTNRFESHLNARVGEASPQSSSTAETGWINSQAMGTFENTSPSGTQGENRTLSTPNAFGGPTGNSINVEELIVIRRRIDREHQELNKDFRDLSQLFQQTVDVVRPQSTLGRRIQDITNTFSDVTRRLSNNLEELSHFTDSQIKAAVSGNTASRSELAAIIGSLENVKL